MSSGKKKGLGRGLSALFGDQQSNEKSVEKKQLNTLSISDLSRNPYQPRNTFNEIKLEELVSSIKKNGIIQPIAVRPKKDESGKFEIVAGERRWLAAQKAGLHEVPVVVLNAKDIQSLELAVIENIQRENLNSVEEARGYDRLVKEFKYSHEKLSEFMGKSKSHISNTLRLLSLPAEVIKLVDEGLLTAGQVRPLVGRYNALDLAKVILKDKLSARSIENMVKNENEKESKTLAVPKRTDANILLAQRQIEENLGLLTKIFSRKNNSGKIVIEFSNPDQFHMLSKLLIKKK